MITWEKIEFIINIVLTVISVVGAYKSLRCFKKSKRITIYAQSNKALNELSEMLNLLPEVLACASSAEKKGFNLENAVSEKGTELVKHLNAIMNAIPSEYSVEFRALQKRSSFDLEKYIHSLIDKSAVIEENGRKTLERINFDTCQERLLEMQECLKNKIDKEEGRLK